MFWIKVYYIKVVETLIRYLRTYNLLFVITSQTSYKVHNCRKGDEENIIGPRPLNKRHKYEMEIGSRQK